jgi:hypothetical protein
MGLTMSLLMAIVDVPASAILSLGHIEDPSDAGTAGHPVKGHLTGDSSQALTFMAH